MATSGTVGMTVIGTNRVIEHAMRRAGVPPSLQTPEIVQIAQDCLYLLLTHYSNTSLNLWCISPALIPLVEGQLEYSLPVGTNDLLNVQFCTPQLASGSLVGNDLILDSLQGIVRVGVEFSVTPASFVLQSTVDGVDFSLIKTVTPTGSVTWFDLDPRVSSLGLKVVGGTVSHIWAATSVSEIPVEPLNRDQYSDLPNKTQSSSTVVNYQFRKTLNPTIVTWPVISEPQRHLSLWVHRQVEDVGSLGQTLAIPQRWFEATIIQLAFRLAMEIPGVPIERITLLQGLAGKFNIEATAEETDSAPTYVQPGISPYTR